MLNPERSIRRRRLRGVSALRPRAVATMAVFALLVSTATSREAVAGQGIWTSAAELSSLPSSGKAWEELEDAANSSTKSPDLSDQNDGTNVDVMAKALVYARTGIDRYRDEVIDACMDAIGSESGGRTLALGRELPAYVIAADLVGLPANKDSQFRSWLAGIRDRQLDGRTLISTHEDRPNNWGTHAGAARIAVALYLGDDADLDRAADVFKGWLGDRSAYSGFEYGSASWQADPDEPVGINPKNATRQGRSIDGVLPDDQRRGGDFRWPPPRENYVYEGLQGALAQAVMLHRAGYDAFGWSDFALLRAFEWLHDEADFPAEGDDGWQPHIVNHYYGTSFPAPVPASPGKNVGWTDWSHSGGSGGGPIGDTDLECSDAPLLSACRSPRKAQVVVTDGGAKRPSTVVLNWLEGEESTPSDFGAPTFNTDYGLCLYDSVDGTPTLVGELTVAGGPAWDEARNGRFRLKQKSGALDGKLVVELRVAEPGKAKARVKAVGTNLPLPGPIGSDAYFEQDPTVIAELINSDGDCWSAEFDRSDTAANKGARFRANAR